METVSLKTRLFLLRRFLVVDWFVLHCHLPAEVVHLCRALTIRKSKPGELVVEAGCWQGGSTAKLSILCRLTDRQLLVFDSFEGVEPVGDNSPFQDWKVFSGQYAAGQKLVEGNVGRYGTPDVCRFIKGWFSDTLATTTLPGRVRVAYIDCDLAKATQEALDGIVPALCEDGVIFSQDFHILPVRKLLTSPEFWKRYERGMPKVRALGPYLASLSFKG
jgi:O-methyltransferase